LNAAMAILDVGENQVITKDSTRKRKRERKKERKKENQNFEHRRENCKHSTQPHTEKER